MSSTHTRMDQFRATYRALRKSGQDGRTPIILIEGDSWFATPLYPNLADAVVARTQGLFLRLAKSGDTALNIFSAKNLAKLENYLRWFSFDAVLLSAGGNDLVDGFLENLFRGQVALTPRQAIAAVRGSQQFEKIRKAYQCFADMAATIAPNAALFAHTYAYPMLLGKPAVLTVTQLGLAALFKRSVGDWIDKHLQKIMPDKADRLTFVHALIDQYREDVLERVRHPNFHVIDMRNRIQAPSFWNDEMHPTAHGFNQLGLDFALRLKAGLPIAKQAAIDAR